MLRRPSKLLLAVLVPCLLAACTAGPTPPPTVVVNDQPPASDTTSSQSQVAPLPPLAQPQSPTVEWSDCADETRRTIEAPALPSTMAISCGDVSTSLDAPDLPSRTQTHIALLKAGTGPIPLVVLDDAEGEPGTFYAAHLAAKLPPALLAKFSLIGMDRRGTGSSQPPIACVPGEVRGPLLGQDPAGGDGDAVLDAARRAGQQCAIELGSLQQAIDSWRSAGDLEQVRDELGVPKLNVIARGEATDVLTAYFNRYPSRVGRVVLDGLPDPSPDPAVVLGDLASAQQATLDAFGADCAARHCAMGGDATAAVSGLLDQVRAAPVTLAGGTELSPGVALNAVLAGLADRDRWPELADAIQAARNGNPAPLAEFLSPMLPSSSFAPSRLDGALATECNDSATRLPANQISALTDTLRSRSPLFGGLVTQRLAWCLPWPPRTDPQPSLGATGLPPILVTSTKTDPVTPEQGTIRAAQQLAGAVRVAWQGTAHGAMGSACVAQSVTSFLVDGKVPADGTLCPA